MEAYFGCADGAERGVRRGRRRRIRRAAVETKRLPQTRQLVLEMPARKAAIVAENSEQEAA